MSLRILLLATSLAIACSAAAPDIADAQPNRRMTGSAFLVGSAGYLVTNAHVVTACDDPRLIVEGTESAVQVALTDPSNDLALLYGDALKGRSGLSIRTDFRVGEPLTVFGFPIAAGLADNGRPTIGVLIGLSNDRRRLITNAQVKPGNSGGPIFDQSGSVVGVASAKSVNRTFAMSAQAVSEMLATMRLEIPMARETSILSVSDVVAKARRSTGKVVCRN